jgi:hypothetical protein
MVNNYKVYQNERVKLENTKTKYQQIKLLVQKACMQGGMVDCCVTHDGGW